MLGQRLTSSETSQSYKKGKIRFVLLFLVVAVAFGNEYAFNNPQALEETFYQHLHISETQFQLFYSLYSLPNVFTLLFIGFYVDLFGVRISIVLLSFLLVLFQLLFAIGGAMGSYPFMLVARILFGIASRSLFIPQASIISFWFKGRQLSFAMGIGITFPELGNALNSYLTPLIYDKTGDVGTPLFVSVGICGIGFLCALIVAYIDKKAEQIDLLNDVQSESSQISIQSRESAHEEIKWGDLKKLNNSFWIVSVLCTVTMAQYIPFLDNVNRLLQKRFCFKQTSAGEAIMITYLVTAIFSGPLGILVNKIGFRRYFIMSATVIFTMAHMIIWLIPQCSGDEQFGAVWGLFWLGVGYSFYANCIVAAIPLCVKKKVVGTAFGIMEIISSLAEFAVPIWTGFLVETADSPQQGYKQSSLFFVILGFSGIFISFSLLFLETKMKKKLDRSEKQTIAEITNYNEEFEIPSEYKRIEEDNNEKNLFDWKARLSFEGSSSKQNEAERDNENL